MKISFPSYIRPDKGQTVYELAVEIYNEKQMGNIGDKMFLTLPDGSDIELKGSTVSEIRDSISTQYKESHF